MNRTVRGILLVSMCPPSTKAAWLMTSAWAAALLFAVAGVVLYLQAGNLAAIGLWWDAAFAALDIYMLRLCIQGILYRRARRGKVRRRA